MEKTILTGTYSERGSKGIYVCRFADGHLEQPAVFAEVKAAKAIAVDPDSGRIASVMEEGNEAGVEVFERDGSLVAALRFETTPSCYVAWNGGRIYTANYHEGTVSVISLHEQELHLDNRVLVRDGAGCHQVLFHGDQVLVPCLFLDRIMIFDRDLNYQSSIRFAFGTGIRHGVFTADGSTLYAVSELSNELFEIKTNNWSIVRRASVLPEGEQRRRGTAAVRLSPDEKTLYVSTRGIDLISVIPVDSLTVKQAVYSGGRHPRDIFLVDNYLLAANRYSDNIAVFELEDDGCIGRELQALAVPSPVSIQVL
ncbi:MAG: beta-propeller fold lactonase family protein [Lachnospiraceae bacterium]|uniref:beta-propeller fold lactonase family protein n=1 Tax=Galactobacillus timonensis TaxID=2041840 RepID=UPI0023F2540E|nr:beta-propeller fold lactonase family protein [Galactobacillus timonensis]MDD6680165.1 beta-propeller fold lactonase family protein [Galactobacillus timonensis]MDD7086322.1 beta-propeller fold lactonase family protein [Galactobacillus timonensis]MDY5222326.1 beta-propeller fold lactonase family protein [Lachnospiraceae bacterium]